MAHLATPRQISFGQCLGAQVLRSIKRIGAALARLGISFLGSSQVLYVCLDG